MAPSQTHANVAFPLAQSGNGPAAERSGPSKDEISRIFVNDLEPLRVQPVRKSLRGAVLPVQDRIARTLLVAVSGQIPRRHPAPLLVPENDVGDEQAPGQFVECHLHRRDRPRFGGM